MRRHSDFRIAFERIDRRTHVLRTAMRLPLDIQTVFAFFCDALNLERITPPELRFHIATAQPLEMAEDTKIDYHLHLFGLPFIWRTNISLWEPPIRFVDEQLEGPYKEWIHTHLFFEEAGTTTISDEVRYRLPLWPAGELSAPLIASQLRRIFRYRKAAIESILMGSNQYPLRLMSADKHECQNI